MAARTSLCMKTHFCFLQPALPVAFAPLSGAECELLAGELPRRIALLRWRRALGGASMSSFLIEPISRIDF